MTFIPTMIIYGMQQHRLIKYFKKNYSHKILIKASFCISKDIDQADQNAKFLIWERKKLLIFIIVQFIFIPILFLIMMIDKTSLVELMKLIK